MQQGERVAIVGLGGIFPGAPDPGRFWANVAKGVDSTREVPEGRWLLDVADAYDPAVGAADRVYSTRGGFIEGFTLDPEGLDVDPELLGRLDPTFHLALHAGRQAWRDAATEGLDRGRVGVVLGNIVLPTEASSALARESLGRVFEERLGIRNGEPQATDPRNACVAGLPAGLLATALGLGGGAYTLDAACASSLYALRLASDELLSGRADAMLAGGLSRPDPLYTQMGFSQLRALSASGKPSPFDAKGDGLVVGEGAGIFVLKRLGDALRHGDRIYATIAAVGLSNDVDGGLLAPSSEGQLRAMRSAYERAGWDPRDVDLIECHATGTPVGDAVEFQSLRTLWGPEGWSPGRCTIGSVKSNIGHALTAAGAAGLLKVLFAIGDRTLPPTANFTTPGPKLDYEGGPFRVLTESRDWQPRDPGRPRRAAISGFGFGGINAHALIEEWLPGSSDVGGAGRGHHDGAGRGQAAVPVAIVGMSAHFGPYRGLRAFQERVLGAEDTGGPSELKDGWRPSDTELRGMGADPSRSPRHGYPIEELTLRADRFRIPPKELEEMLPQQSLALEVAADAIADAGWDDRPRLRAGVFVGIGLDLNTTNFHVRWSMLDNARRWNRELGLGLSGDALDHWATGLRDAVGPALSANRTMGALGGIVASRIAREFRVGGPSFTVSSEETSGTRALDVAAQLLGKGEIDEAIVGAVDLACDPRAVACTDSIYGRPAGREPDASLPCDGAAALVLKRLDDAVRDGDRIYAVIRGVGVATGTDDSAYRDALERGHAASGVAPSGLGYLEIVGSSRPDEGRRETPALADFGRDWAEGPSCALGTVRGDVGHAGAASGLASVVKAALGLHQQILPPLRGTDAPDAGILAPGSPFFVPRGPQFWLRDRDRGPRRAGVSSLGVDGNALHVVLEAYEPQAAANTTERLQPLGTRAFALFAIEADDPAGILHRADELEALVEQSPNTPVEELARRWWRVQPNDPTKRLGLGLVAHEVERRLPGDRGRDEGTALLDLLDEARRRIRSGGEGTAARRRSNDHLFLTSGRLEPGARVAFVFPGLGNHFAGMGRELSAFWPEILRAQDQESARLGSQLAPGSYWNADPPETFDDHRAPIIGQVSFGAFVADLLRDFGLAPEATIGYSLGESTALFALRAWTGRDAMLERVQVSPLFRNELAGPCEAARRAWGLAEGEAADWIAGIVPNSAEAARAALAGKNRAYLLIVNTPREAVIGGDRAEVYRVARALGGRFFPLPLVSTIHCPVVRQVEPEYRALHLLETTPPPGIRFYSGASGKSNIPGRESAADAIVAHAILGIDFPNVVERAYADGIRAFVEVGPGGSCSRMIGKILGDRPHLARPACVAGLDPLATILGLLASLVAERVPLDLSALYGRETLATGHRDLSGPEPPSQGPSKRLVRVKVGARPIRIPRPLKPTTQPSIHHERPSAPAGIPRPTPGPALVPSAPTSYRPVAEPVTSPDRQQVPLAVPNLLVEPDPLTHQLLATEAAKAEAHEAFLRVSGNIGQTLSNQLSFQMALIEALMAEPSGTIGFPAESRVDNGVAPYVAEVEEPRPRVSLRPDGPRPALDRDQCLEFAVGSIAAVLGAEFAPIDAHPTRVRLPDEPLMLVDRILEIEGEARSMGGGRVVTEHDVLPGAWYLDGGRIPTCIAVESGQADLFLSGYLGIDFITKGLAVYRLLDAVVTFHRELPGPGDVIRYDIHIDHFFRQGETYLFRFHFEATVDGAPLMSMKDGCAGFFSAEALAAGQGIVAPRIERQSKVGGRPDDWQDLVPLRPESYDDRQVDALRRGDLASAFGPMFEGLPLASPTRLPGGRMTLVHRVLSLEPAGGRFGLGLIRAEADIRPSDWFMTCHFVDDRVMPGTLMFECCLHTLRIFLMRMGWIGEHDEVSCDPVPGIASRLKCRGQVIESTKVVTYEVSIKELGYRPEPYAVVDALMYADGKPIVEITDMSLRMSGLSFDALRQLWAHRAPSLDAAPAPAPADEPAALYDEARILAFAIGKPSEAFGEPYRVFDADRVIARLPGPPFQFLSRITAIEAEPWKMVAGGVIEARYDIPPLDWYFDAERSGRMPFAVLLEAALQPCGWLAAYIGSALTSDVDLKFRNLGGSAVQFEEVTPSTGTLVTDVRITKVSRSGGMVIQNYEFEVRAGGRMVYRGDTYFGFFRAEALAEQIGLRDAALYRPTEAEQARARTLDYPRTPPFPDDRLRMIDRIDVYLPDGGAKGLGFIQGSQDVDDAAWYFKAHFHQDPVCPGSLGLESFLQLLKFAAAERWGVGDDPTVAFESVALGDTHRWTYRGQVLPTAGRVVVQATVTEVDDQRRWLKADGFLTVDGRTIFQMNDFTIKIA